MLNEHKRSSLRFLLMPLILGIATVSAHAATITINSSAMPGTIGTPSTAGFTYSGLSNVSVTPNAGPFSIGNFTDGGAPSASQTAFTLTVSLNLGATPISTTFAGSYAADPSLTGRYDVDFSKTSSLGSLTAVTFVDGGNTYYGYYIGGYDFGLLSAHILDNSGTGKNTSVFADVIAASAPTAAPEPVSLLTTSLAGGMLFAAGAWRKRSAQKK